MVAKVGQSIAPFARCYLADDAGRVLELFESARHGLLYSLATCQALRM